MEVDFTKNFQKQINLISNQNLLTKIEFIIEIVIKVNAISDIPNIKKLSGYTFFYRIKVGDYRIGVEKIENQIRFLTIQHRKDIYKKFP